MIASDRGRGSIALRAGALAALLAAGSCEDFPRTNPFDTQALVPIVLSGPDSVTSIGDTITFEVRTAQGESLDQLASWTVPVFLAPLGPPNRFLVTGMPSSGRGAGTVSVQVNGNQSSKPIVFAQKATAFSLTWCDGRVKTINFTSLLVGYNPMMDAQFVCGDLLDRRGNVVPDPSTLSGTIRDSGVVRFTSPDRLFLNAVSVGSTWIVYTRAGFTDSVRAVVRQDPVGLTVDPPQCNTFGGILLAPGDTLRLTARAPVIDAHLNPLTDSAIIQQVLASVQWTHESYLDVSPTGLVTAVGQGGPDYVIATMTWGGEQIPAGGCYVNVR
jgi:hypothetical protein